MISNIKEFITAAAVTRASSVFLSCGLSATTAIAASISKAFQAPFKFTGTLKKVTVEILQST